MGIRARSLTLRTAPALAALLAWSARGGPEPVPAPLPQLVLSPADRVLVLAPHPDDETLGAGGIIEKAARLGLPLRIVFLTNGDANQWSFTLYRRHPVFEPKAVEKLGLVRRSEAVAAAGLLGADRRDLFFLGYPDLGTLRIFSSHWGESPPLRSELTRVSRVPYPDSYRPGAPYKGESILEDLEALIREFRPTKVFVSHPADGNPDHRALYLFTRLALWDLEPRAMPQVYPYLIHYEHRDWPAPRGYRPGLPLVPPASFDPDAWWTVSPLTPAESRVKRDAVEAHRTQTLYSGRYMSSFARSNELFGDLPPVALAAPREGGPRDKRTGEERGSIVGLELRSARLEDGELVQSVSYTRPPAREASVSFSAFGWRRDVPFGAMPKLRVEVGPESYRVFDGESPAAVPGVLVEREALHVTVRIPLKALGDPRRVFVSTRSTLADLPLDAAAWRILEP